MGHILGALRRRSQLAQPLSEDPRTREARDVMRLRQLAVAAGATRA